MTGTIAQAVAITIHGNSILQRRLALEGDEFQERNSTFKFCESVNFIEHLSDPSKGNETLYAANVRDWFERLGREGAVGFRLSYGASGERTVPDRKLAGFVGGGGQWLIEARGPGSSDFWQPRWQIGNRGSRDRRIWRVFYDRVLSKMPLTEVRPENLQPLRLELKQCLEQIAQFARAQKLELFAQAFESGIARLESPDPLADAGYPDIAPPGFLSPAANQLLGCAQDAWVFGGMGSWNDLGFEGEVQARYDQLSEQLYQLLNRVIVAAANSSAS